MQFEVLVEIGQMLLHQQPDEGGVLVHSWQAYLEDVPQLALFY